MTISSLALAAKKVIDAAWLHGDAYDLASQAAFALESAQLLMSPEVAAELEQLRAQVAALLEERHSTNEALDDAVQALRADRDEPAAPYVSRLLPPRDAVCARPECGHSGEEHHHGDTKCWAHLPKKHGDPITICGCSGFVEGPSAVESADKLTRTFAPTQALREDVTPQVTKLQALLAGQREAVDGEHYAAVHHAYRVPRDLPELGGGK